MTEYFKCTWCNNYYVENQNDSKMDVDGDPVCFDCRQELGIECPTCGALVHKDEELSLCPVCGEPFDITEEGI